MKLVPTSIAVWAVLLATAGLVQANPWPLDGLQETPPVATPGSGLASIAILDQSAAPDDWLLSWNIAYSGLVAPATLAHFHGPAGPGVPAGVRVDIGAISGLISPMIGSTTISDAFAGELMAGLWYINIHSSAFPGGEIRGQVPEPATLGLLAAGGLALLRRRYS